MLKKYDEVFQVKEEPMNPGGRSCLGCGGGIVTRMVLKAVGPNAVTTVGSCGTNTTNHFPVGQMSTIPIPIGILGAPGAALSGLEVAARVKGNEDAIVVGMLGDGDASDIGFGNLSACFERGHKVIVVVVDNQGYSATGGQRSGTTGLKAWTRSTPKGKSRPPKYLPFIMLAHGAPYVATCSVGYPEDLFERVKKATKRENQPAFIQCINPCPMSWKTHPSMTVEVCKRAVTSGIWPLWEYERGTFRRTIVPKKLTPVEDYLSLQGRFNHLTGDDIEEIKAYIKDLNETVDKYAEVYSKYSEYQPATVV